MTLQKEVKINQARQLQNRSAWKLSSIVFNSIGIAVGLAILLFGFVRAYLQVDSIWVRWIGEIPVQIVELNRDDSSPKTIRYYTTIEIPPLRGKPSFKLRVDNQTLYQYILRREQHSHLPKLDAVLIQSVISGRPYVAQVGPIRLLQTPKSAEFIVYLGLLVLGVAIIFTATRELYKRWIRRGLEEI
jgi:hypothetical protein